MVVLYGAGCYHHTGLRNNNSPPDNVGTEAPALAIVVDPDDKNIVYVGTAVGVWRGVLTFAGNTPQWKWRIFERSARNGRSRPLFLQPVGAEAAARGARLERHLGNGPECQPQAGGANLPARAQVRHPAPSVHVVDQSAVRGRDRPVLPLACESGRPHTPGAGRTRSAVSRGLDAPRRRQPPNRHAHAFWAFQTAFRTLQPLCRPNGSWTNQFESLLRVQFGQARAEINETIWNTVVTAGTVFTPPWGDDDPTEADLYELIVEPESDGTSIPELPELDRRAYHIDVLVHHRDQRPLRPDQVRVTLLRRLLTGPRESWGNLAISAAWKGRVQQLLSGNPLPPGFSLVDGWRTASTPAVLSPRGPIEVRTPRAVSFDINFTAVTGPRTRHVLLAIVHSDADPVTVASLAGSTLQELVEFSHHVAARTIDV